MLSETASSKKTDLPLDMSGVVWRPFPGRRGPYEKAENNGSPVYKRLVEGLKQSGGSFSADGWIVWLWPDHVSIGRRALKLCISASQETSH